MKPNLASALGIVLGSISLIGIVGTAAMNIERSQTRIQVLEKDNAKLIDKVDELRTQAQEFGWWSSAVRQELKELKSRR